MVTAANKIHTIMQKQSGRPIDRSKDTAILRAARDILFEHGPQAVTMEAVAARAAVSKATVYARHPDRDQLLRVVVEAESFAMTQALETSPRTAPELTAALMAFVQSLSSFLASKRHLRLMQVMGSSARGMARARREIYLNGPQQTHHALTAYLASATEAGLIRCPDPAQSAELLLGMLMGLDLVRASYGMPLKPKRVEDKKQHAHFIVTSFLALHDRQAGMAGG
jgi:TetR/AcrR family transcriptional regulator, mexJK operon transcriptional repressor